MSSDTDKTLEGLEELQNMIEGNNSIIKDIINKGDKKQDPQLPDSTDNTDGTGQLKGSVVVRSLKIEISGESIEKSIDSLAASTGAPDFNDAMELVWFNFNPKKDNEMMGQMSLLDTLRRATLDGSVRPPIDLEDLYQERYQMLTQNKAVDNRGPDASTAPAPSPQKKIF